MEREGELKAQNQCEILGEIIKGTCAKADMTIETLANKVDVTERFIYRIENKGEKSSYGIPYKLIRESVIVSDQIFFPEKQVQRSEMGSPVRILYSYGERSTQVIEVTIKVTLESQFKG